MPSWIAFGLNPADAFLDIAVEALAGKLSAATTRTLLGTPVERALRDAFGAAIDRVVAQVPGKPETPITGPGTASSAQLSLRAQRKDELRASLRARRKELARPREFQDLRDLVATWTETVERELGQQHLEGLGVPRGLLADMLCTAITEEVHARALKGGPLHPLATATDLQRILGQMQEIQAGIADIKGGLGELHRLGEQRAEHVARPEGGYAARTVIEDKTASFTGREYLVKQIDHHIIGDPAFRSGYVLVVGEPGIGKTALLSHLIKTRGYLHHINNRRQGITSTHAFLRDICCQLAEMCHLPAPEDPDSSILSTLLHRAAAGATAGTPLVLAIDALDESDLPASLSANRLLLPPILPPHVYFLITSRPQRDYQLNVDNPRVIRIEDDDPLNLLDIRRYIDEQLNGPDAADFASRIRNWNVNREDFVNILIGKSQGNFLYIFHMLTSIRLNRLSRAALDDVRQLPQGLSNYYEHHWNVMADLWPADLREKHQSAVRCMAAVSRPMSVKMLVRIAGEENLPGVDEELAFAIFETWREFFNSEVDRDTGEELLYVYHDTFREFLNDDESLASLAHKLRRRQNMLLRQRLERYS